MKKLISVALILCTLLLSLSLFSCNGERRDIRSVEVNEDGELVLTFTDGTKSNIGRVSGEDGKDGKDGEKGEAGARGTDGTNGRDGANGTNGIDGKNGSDGKGIVSVSQNEQGQLVIAYSDGTGDVIDVSFGVLGGACGESAEWALYTGGILMIDGTGETYDYGQGNTPWYSFISGIRAVYVNDLTLSLGENLLYGFDEDIIVTPSELAVSVWIDMTESADIRSSADKSDSSNIIGQAEFGSEWRCLSADGEFAQIIYGGGIVYIESKYVNTDNGSLVFTELDKHMRVGAESLNLRSYTDATDTSNLKATVSAGDTLTVTGISLNERWYRVEYNGQTLYARNKDNYLVDIVSQN